MAVSTILGTNGATLQPARWDWRRGQGRIKTEEYDGPAAAVETLGLDEIAQPTAEWTTISYQEDMNGGAHLVLSHEPEDPEEDEEGIIREFWELDRTLQVKPLRIHPFWAGTKDNTASTIPGAEPDPDSQKTYMDRVEEYVQAGKLPTFGAGDFAGATTQTKQYYYFRKAGVEGFNFATYVLRRVRRTARTSSVKPAHDDVNTVVAYPAGAPKYIGDITAAGGYEWLKQTPEIQIHEDETRDLVEEYWSGTPTWGVFYGGSWDPTP